MACGDEAGWRVVVGDAQQGGRDGLNRSDQGLDDVNDGQGEIDGWRDGGELRMRVGVDLGAAAAHLDHVAAVALHGFAAGTLFARHRNLGHAGQQRRCGREQDEDREEGGEASHT